jgi:hypothetical protein
MGCADNGGQLQARLASQATGSPFAMAQVTPFGWDRLFIYPPYTNPERIDSEVGIRVDAAHGTFLGDGSMLTRSDVCMLVFRDGSRLAAVTEVNVHQLDFQPAVSPRSGYGAEARFLIRAGTVRTVYPASS